MRIGLTYDSGRSLQPRQADESDRVFAHHWETVDAVSQAIMASGHELVLIGNGRNLIDRLAAGEQADLVFNLCQGALGSARRAQVPAILDAFGIAYTFADPLVMSMAAHKGHTKSLLRDSGIPTSDYWVVETFDDLSRVESVFPVFAKPIGQSAGCASGAMLCAGDAAQLSKICCSLLSEFAQPVLIEPFLPGREFVVSLLGHGSKAEVLGTMERCAGGSASDETAAVAEYAYCDAQDAMVARCEQIALAAWRMLGGCDAGQVELKGDADGRPQVLQIETLPDLHPIGADLPMTGAAAGLSYPQLIETIIDAASQRASRRSLVQHRLTPSRPHLLARRNETVHFPPMASSD